MLNYGFDFGDILGIGIDNFARKVIGQPCAELGVELAAFAVYKIVVVAANERVLALWLCCYFFFY